MSDERPGSDPRYQPRSAGGWRRGVQHQQRPTYFTDAGDETLEMDANPGLVEPGSGEDPLSGERPPTVTPRAQPTLSPLVPEPVSEPSTPPLEPHGRGAGFATRSLPPQATWFIGGAFVIVVIWLAFELLRGGAGAGTAASASPYAAGASPSSAAAVTLASSSPSPSASPSATPKATPKPTVKKTTTTIIATPRPTTRPIVRKTPAPTPKPTLRPTPVPTVPPGGINVKILRLTTLIKPGSYASVTAETNAPAYCSITIPVGGASGMTPKWTNSVNQVTWSWTIPSDTPGGVWTLSIRCELDSSVASVTGQFQVQ